MAYINGSDDFVIVLNVESGETSTPSVDGVIFCTNDKGIANPLFIPYGIANNNGGGDDDDTIKHTISVFATNILTDGVTSVKDGVEYRATFTPYIEEYNSGNVSDNCRVFMGGNEITGSVMWEGNTLTIAPVTDDVEITFTEIVGDYYEDMDGNNSVKLVLANVYAADTSGNVLGNGSRYVMSGDPFWCDLYAIEGEGTEIDCTVTRDGEDITSQCAGDENFAYYRQIRIDMVGGDIVITAIVK